MENTSKNTNEHKMLVKEEVKNNPVPAEVHNPERARMESDRILFWI